MDNPELIDPLVAPFWRKWLALRVLALSAASLFLALLLGVLLDEAKINLPHWLSFVYELIAVLAFFAFFANLANGVSDLVVHFVPPGRIRQALLRGGRSPEQIAKEFGETGYLFALYPFFIVIGLLVVALVFVLLLGGLSALGNVWTAVSGWPSWAIVITILLLLILLK